METAWASLLEAYRGWHGEKDLPSLVKAYRLLQDLTRAYGAGREESTPHHGLAVGTHVAELGGEAPVVCAALLHGIYERRDERAHRHFLEQEFGREVVELLEGADVIQRSPPGGEGEEAWRALLHASQEEPRLVLLLLAHRLARLETMVTQPDEEVVRSFAAETLRIYRPLTVHLGVVKVQEALEDLCCRILSPSEYAVAAAGVVAAIERVRGRTRGLEREVRAIDRVGDVISFDVRHPRVASVLLAGGGKEKEGGNLIESTCIDVVVGSPEKAYRFVLLLHARWKPVPGGFRDYIVSPRPSGYQALHTEVFTEQCGRVTFRIATPVMGQRNAYGLLMGGLVRQEIDALLSGDMGEDTRLPSPPAAGGVRDVVEEQKVVYDEHRQQHAIPLEATALDAAFLLYAEDAAYASEVFVDGTHVSLSAAVPEGSVVTIAQAGTVQVRTEWLTEVATTIVTFAIQRALKRRSFEEKSQLGRRILQKQFDVVQSGVLVSALTEESMARTARTFGAASFDVVLARLAEGVLSATDVYGALFPEDQGGDRGFRERVESLLNHLLHRVCLRATFSVAGTSGTCPDPVGTVSDLARRRGIEIHRETLTVDPAARTFHLRFSCTAPDRASLLTFLLSLEQEIGFTSVRALLPRSRRLIFLILTFLSLLAWLTPFVTLPFLTTGFSQGVALTLSLFPAVAANVLLFYYVRSYIARFRESTHLFLAGGALNVLALSLFILLVTYAAPAEAQMSLLGVLVLFVTASLFTTYRFLATHGVLHPLPRGEPLSEAQWCARLRRKAAGYAFRLMAVTVWGIQPLYFKYTPASVVEPLPRVFLMSVGIVLLSLVLLAVRAACAALRGASGWTPRIPRDRYLLGTIVGAGLFYYFLNASLRLTTSTNFLLLNQSSSIFALLLAALLWRRSIPYLKEPRHMLWIFLLFLLGSSGGGLIVYNDVRSANLGTVAGDALSIVAMFADTLLTTSEIRYMKLHPTVSTPMLNFFVFGLLAVALFPPFALAPFLGFSAPWAMAMQPLLFGVGAGVLIGVGLICNFETFRRIEGFLALLMFNISILITFITEVLFLGAFSPTGVLLLGGVTIIGSTVLAEVINSRCERRGL